MKQILSLFILLLLFYNHGLSAQTNSFFEKELKIDACIEYALKNNPNRLINENTIKISEAQLDQAYSAYWPQVDLTASFSTLDEDPNFIFPSTVLEMPSLNIPGLELGPIAIPQQDIKILDKTIISGSLELVYPLYTGGYISSLIGQAEGGLLLAKEKARKNELQLIADVKKRFYGVLVLQELSLIGEETVAALETTLELTENLYLKGSGSVTKTDFLKNKILVDNVRSINATFQHKLELAKAALLNSLGEKNVNQEFTVAESETDYTTPIFVYDELLNITLQNNPTWKTLEIAETIFEEKVDEAFSGHLPRIGLMASTNIIENSYSYGFVTDKNKFSWSMGIGLQLPIFNGFRTSAKIDEANYRLQKIQSQKALLENGISIMVKKALVDYNSAVDQNLSLKSAMDSAIENRDLNDRAYQSDLVELQDLLEAQLFEAIMKVQYYNAKYTYYEMLTDLELTIGKN